MSERYKIPPKDLGYSSLSRKYDKKEDNHLFIGDREKFDLDLFCGRKTKKNEN